MLQVFRKFSNSLGPDALQFLEAVLDENEIVDEEIETSIEVLAKEYNKEDGACHDCGRLFFLTSTRRHDEGVRGRFAQSL